MMSRFEEAYDAYMQELREDGVRRAARARGAAPADRPDPGGKPARGARAARCPEARPADPEPAAPASRRHGRRSRPRGQPGASPRLADDEITTTPQAAPERVAPPPPAGSSRRRTPRRRRAMSGDGGPLLRAGLRPRPPHPARAGRHLRPGGGAPRRAPRGARRGLGAAGAPGGAARPACPGTAWWARAGASRSRGGPGPADPAPAAARPRACASAAGRVDLERHGLARLSRALTPRQAERSRARAGGTAARSASASAAASTRPRCRSRRARRSARSAAELASGESASTAASADQLVDPAQPLPQIVPVGPRTRPRRGRASSASSAAAGPPPARAAPRRRSRSASSRSATSGRLARSVVAGRRRPGAAAGELLDAAPAEGRGWRSDGSVSNARVDRHEDGGERDPRLVPAAREGEVPRGEHVLLPAPGAKRRLDRLDEGLELRVARRAGLAHTRHHVELLLVQERVAPGPRCRRRSSAARLLQHRRLLARQGPGHLGVDPQHELLARACRGPVLRTSS